jgi:hypothetical protein
MSDSDETFIEDGDDDDCSLTTMLNLEFTHSNCFYHGV